MGDSFFCVCLCVCVCGREEVGLTGDHDWPGRQVGGGMHMQRRHPAAQQRVSVKKAAFSGWKYQRYFI